MQIYMDEYYRSFGHGEYDELKLAQRELESQTEWESGITSMSVSPLLREEDGGTGTPMDIEARLAQPWNTISRELLTDTHENSGILLCYAGKEVCLRSCALPSLQNTAGFSGPAVSRVDKFNLAKGFTSFLTGCREKSQVMTRAGKVTAVLSSHYQYMPGTELLEICDDLESTFGPAEFVGGAVSHNSTVAEFEFPASAGKISAAYSAALTNAGKPKGTLITPVVQFRVSDTSNGAAKLFTYLKLGPGQMLPVGVVSVPHIPPLEFINDRRITCIEKFEQEIGLLFSKMEYAIADLIPKMAAIKINHPGNAFVGLCKYAGIPQKWGGLVEEDVRFDWPDGSDCSFLDLYEEMTRVTALAVKDGFHPQSKRILELEEGICKVARNQASWKKFDLPGTVAWSAVRLSDNTAA